MSAWIAASLLVITGLVHSIGGETSIITPLLRNKAWEIGIPRAAVDVIIRFAWHLTTIAWFALAAIVVGADAGVAFGICCLAGAAIVFVMLRGHLAWPLFLGAGLYAFDVSDALPAVALQAFAWTAIAVAVAAAAIHVSWAMGSRWLASAVVPTKPQTGEPLFRPGAVATLAVAAALTAAAGLMWWTAFGDSPAWAWWLAAAAALVFVLRAFGEGTYVGLLKENRDTPFAIRDDLYYTPLVVALAVGAIAALHLAGAP